MGSALSSDDRASSLAADSAMPERAVSEFLFCLPPLLLIALLFAPIATELFAAWRTDPNYSHGPLVPLACLAFAWMAYRSERGDEDENDAVTSWEALVGLFTTALALVVYFAAWFCGSPFFVVMALSGALLGVLATLGGFALTRRYAFAAGFLIFMAPWPAFWYQRLAITMQNFVSVISAHLLDATGVPVFRQGYLLHMPDYTMEVGAACSGLRQLTAVLALALALGYLSGRRWPFILIVAALAIPIAIASNCVRILVTGWILILAGRRWAEGVFHTLEGLACVAIAAVLTVGAVWLLGRFDDYWLARQEARV